MATKNSTKAKTQDAPETPAPKAAAKAPAKAAPAKATEAKDSKGAKAPEAKPAPVEAKSDAQKKGIGKPVTPSADLAAVIGVKEPLPRTEVVSKVWEYIRKHDLQVPSDKRTIKADDKLKAIFGKDSATMFELNKLLSAHLS